MARILLVTDDDDTAQALAQLIVQHGYDVVLARDSRDALESLQNTSIQLAIIDPLWNEDISAAALANALHSFDATLPMIVLDMHDERYSRLLSGINISFISRPFDIEMVMLRLHRKLNP